LGQILIILDMYNKDVKLIIIRKNLSFKKHFTCQILEFKKKKANISQFQIIKFHFFIDQKKYTIILNEKEWMQKIDFIDLNIINWNLM
jgi:hypothetical protein